MARNIIMAFCIVTAGSVEIEASYRKPLVREAASSLMMASVDENGQVALVEHSEQDVEKTGRITMAGCGRHANKVVEECTHIHEPYMVDVRCCGANDEAVSCDEYGDAGSLRQKSYAQASQICSSKGLQMCSAATLRTEDQCQMGCKLDKTRVWSSEPCDAATTTTTPAPPAITNYAMTAAGCGRPEYMEEYPPQCTPVATVVNVRCCLPGSRKERVKKYVDDCGEAKGLTYAQGKELCESKGYVICSQERLADSSKKGLCGTGCGLDKKRVWTGDWCAGPTTSAAPTTAAATTTAAPTTVAPATDAAEEAAAATTTTTAAPTTVAPATAAPTTTTGVPKALSGCLMKEAGGKYAWLQHTDGTYNWVSRASADCIAKAGHVSAEHISELTMRSENYALNEAQSQEACKNDACELDTEGCLLLANGYYYIAHADNTRNWIDVPALPDSGCAKATHTSKAHLETLTKRHGGKMKGIDWQNGEPYPFPSYNLGSDDSALACQRHACPATPALVESPPVQDEAEQKAPSLEASDTEWQREMRVRFGADFVSKVAENKTASKAHSSTP